MNKLSIFILMGNGVYTVKKKKRKVRDNKVKLKGDWSFLEIIITAIGLKMNSTQW